MDTKNIHILIIDDDPNILELCQTRFPSFQCIGIQTLSAAKNTLSKNIPIDIILLDYKLSKDNGLTLIPHIRKKKPWIPIIILTAYVTKDTLLQAISYKPDAFLEKPIQFEKLKVTIESLCNKFSTQNKTYKNIINTILLDYEKNSRCTTTLQEYAQKYSCNYKYISRSFKEITGLSFHDFKLKHQLSLAKKLLLTTSMSIKTIAYELGYLNPASFMKSFKCHTQYTPTEFRKKKAEKKHLLV